MSEKHGILVRFQGLAHMNFLDMSVKIYEFVQNFYSKNSRLVLLTSWALFGLVFVVLARAHAFSFNFHDETDHVAVGYFVFRHHLQLYRDIITIHQPLPVLIGGLLSLLVSKSTLYAFVSSLRLLMSLFWVAAGLFLVCRFRERGWWVSLAACLYSYQYFGFFVLSEVLVWPIVAYLFLALAEQLLPLPRQTRRSIAWQEDLWWGILCALAIFNLLPLAPFLLVASLTYVWCQREKWWQRLSFMAAGFLLVAAVLLLWVNPWDWWQQTIVNFVKYWSEDIHLSWLTTAQHWLVYLTYPLVTGFLFWRTPGFLLWSILIIYPLVVTFRRDRMSFYRLVGLYLLVVLLNNRVTTPGVTFYEGFHLIPYIVGLLAWTITAWLLIWPEVAKRVKIDALVLVLIWLGSTGLWLLKGDNRQNKYEILFLPEQSLINVIKTMKQPGDKLLTGEEGYGYLNVLTDLPFADRQNFHLVWSWRSPILRQDFLDTFASQPPTFVYFPDHTGHGMPDLLHEEILPRDYVSVLSPGGTDSDLYVSKTRAESLTDAQKTDLASTYYDLRQASESAELDIDESR